MITTTEPKKETCTQTYNVSVLVPRGRKNVDTQIEYPENAHKTKHTDSFTFSLFTHTADRPLFSFNATDTFMVVSPAPDLQHTVVYRTCFPYNTKFKSAMNWNLVETRQILVIHNLSSQGVVSAARNCSKVPGTL
jgi:hypothetical protein